jgi:hypothetical protein
MERNYQWEEPNTTTGTEMLMKILSRFGEHGEPLAMLVVYTDVNGDVWMKSNCTHTHAIGLATYAQHNVIKAVVGQEDQSR